MFLSGEKQVPVQRDQVERRPLGRHFSSRRMARVIQAAYVDPPEEEVSQHPRTRLRCNQTSSKHCRETPAKGSGKIPGAVATRVGLHTSKYQAILSIGERSQMQPMEHNPGAAESAPR